MLFFAFLLAIRVREMLDSALVRVADAHKSVPRSEFASSAFCGRNVLTVNVSIHVKLTVYHFMLEIPARLGVARVARNQRACGDPACSSFLNGTEGTITAELAALAGIGSKNCYLMLELKQGPESNH
jgi:hypothetical protein